MFQLLWGLSLWRTYESFKITLADGDAAAPLNPVKQLNLTHQYLISGESKVLDGGCGGGEYVLALREKYE